MVAASKDFVNLLKTATFEFIFSRFSHFVWVKLERKEFRANYGGVYPVSRRRCGVWGRLVKIEWNKKNDSINTSYLAMNVQKFASANGKLQDEYIWKFFVRFVGMLFG